MDRPVAFAVGARIIYVASAPLTLLIIQRSLSPQGQGYFFTFASLLALTNVFELGLSQVLLFTASHEQSKIRWTPEGRLQGELAAVGRVTSLTRDALRWYGMIAGVVVAALAPGGILFFSRAEAQGVPVEWLAPWILAVIASATTCLFSPFFAVIEGCGRVAEVQLVRLLQQLAGVVALWVGLVSGARLYAVAASLGASLACAAVWLTLRRRTVADLLSAGREGPHVGWRAEVWPMQWRMALSWIGGWFVFQVFNPIVFMYQGAAEAGRMGMTLTLSQALVSIGSAWTNPKAAHFGKLVAERQYRLLDQKFAQVLRQSVALVLVGGVSVVLGVVAVRAVGHPIADRLLGPWPTAALMGVAVANQIVFAQAVYLRAHREEPLLTVTLVLGVAVTGCTWLLGRFANVDAVAFGYFFLTIVLFLGGGTFVFRTKRREWHGEGLY